METQLSPLSGVIYDAVHRGVVNRTQPPVTRQYIDNLLTGLKDEISEKEIKSKDKKIKSLEEKIEKLTAQLSGTKTEKRAEKKTKK